MTRSDINAAVVAVGVTRDREVVVNAIVDLRCGANASTLKFLRQLVQHAQLGGMATGGGGIVGGVHPFERVKIVDAQVGGYQHALGARFGRHHVELGVKRCVERQRRRRFALI